MLSFQCDNIHIFRAQQSCLASGCQTGQDRLRASAEGEDSLYLEEVSCPCPPPPTTQPSAPLCLFQGSLFSTFPSPRSTLDKPVTVKTLITQERGGAEQEKGKALLRTDVNVHPR